MNWLEARDRTVEQWRWIRGVLGHVHPTDLLSEINLMCPLCETAAEKRAADSAAVADKCAYCIAYQQAGGCRDVCGEISARIAERDWEAARAIADTFIETLQTIESPPDLGIAEPPRLSKA